MSSTPTINPSQINSSLISPDTDLSIQYLARIFGEGWQKYIIGGGAPGESASVLFHLTGVFNTVVLTGVAAMIVYITMIGVVGTAHEGTPLGKRYSTLWTPLRSAFALFLLAPLPGAGGISIVQGIVLAMVYLSIGGANMMHSAANVFMTKNAGAIMTTTPMDGTPELARGILKKIVVQTWTVRNSTEQSIDVPWTTEWVDAPAPNTSWFRGKLFGNDAPPPKSGKYVVTFHTAKPGNPPQLADSNQWLDASKLDTGLRDHDLGVVELACPDHSSAVCTGRLKATLQLIADLRPIAEALVPINIDDSIRAFSGLSQDMRTAIARYDSSVRQVATASIMGGDAEYRRALQQYTTRSTELGWLTLGSWYHTIGAYQQASAEKIKAAPGIVDVDNDTLNKKFGARENRMMGGMVGPFQDSLAVVDRFDSYYRSNRADQSIARGPHSGGSFSGTREWFSRPATAIATTEWLSDGNPITNLQKVGHVVIDAAWVAAGGAAIAAVVPVGKLAAVKDAVTGSGGGKIATVIFALMVVGAVLAFYLPAIPFILWIMAVVGWFIQVFEAFVAAPLWAAAHAVPEGEGVAGQHGKQGYMLFLAILMKPALMVFGFFLSYELIIIVGKLIGDLFGIFATGLMAGYTSGPVTTIALLALVAGLFVAAGHKVFGLITWLPDNVLRWVGQMVQNMGEAESESRTRAIFGAVGGKTEQLASAATAGGSDAAGGGAARGGAGRRGLAADLAMGDAGGGYSAARSMGGTANNSVRRRYTS